MDPGLFETEIIDFRRVPLVCPKFYVPTHEWLADPVYLSGFNLSSEFDQGTLLFPLLKCNYNILIRPLIPCFSFSAVAMSQIQEEKKVGREAAIAARKALFTDRLAKQPSSSKV